MEDLHEVVYLGNEIFVKEGLLHGNCWP
jgi:hypothetical protein